MDGISVGLYGCDSFEITVYATLEKMFENASKVQQLRIRFPDNVRAPLILSRSKVRTFLILD